MELIRPLAVDSELLQDFHSQAEDDRLHLWWLGQSGFLVKWQGNSLLLDPYLSDSLTRKYADTDKPHVRMTERCINPAQLMPIDVVTSSHNHTDHLDAETLCPLMESNPTMEVVVPRANRQFAANRLACTEDRLTPVAAGESVQLGPFEFHGVPAAHDAVERDEQGDCLYQGYVVRFGRWTIYHSGDTQLFEGQVELLQPFDLDLALLPINGRAPERRVAGNLWGKEAAELAHQIGAAMVVPCHYHMFTFNTAEPDEFVQKCTDLSQPFRVMQCGERLTLPI